MTLKELRIWHWNKMNGAIKRSLTSGRSHHYVKEDKQVADFYLSAVVALNAVVPGSVEQDIAYAKALADLVPPASYTQACQGLTKEELQLKREGNIYPNSIDATAFVRCPVCQGNNGDMPCAYPSEHIKGCLKYSEAINPSDTAC